MSAELQDALASTTSRLAKAERYLRIAVPFLRRGEKFESLADVIEQFTVMVHESDQCPLCGQDREAGCA